MSLKFSFEIPKSLLKESLTFNDYGYFLDVFDDKETREFYKTLLRNNKLVILDNSLYERRNHNLNFNEIDYINLALDLYKINPDKLIVIIPDFYDDSIKNIEKVQEYTLYPFRKMAVPHGNSKEDYYRCFNRLKEILSELDYIGLTAGDTFMKDITRYELLKNLNFDKCSYHLLGLKSPDEIPDVVKLTETKNINSIDTSYPITSAIEGYELTKEKPKVKIYDVYNEFIPNNDTINLVYNNIRKLKDMFKTKRIAIDVDGVIVKHKIFEFPNKPSEQTIDDYFKNKFLYDDMVIEEETIKAIEKISKVYDIFFVSFCYKEHRSSKIRLLSKYFNFSGFLDSSEFKNKDILDFDYIIDDRDIELDKIPSHKAIKFDNWDSVLDKLKIN